MKLDLEDGRILSLPDELSDEFARQLKRLILVSEERAATAEAHVVALQAEITHLRAEIQALVSRPLPTQVITDNTAVLAALRRIEVAVRADRVMVADEFGEYTRSRIAS